MKVIEGDSREGDSSAWSLKKKIKSAGVLAVLSGFLLLFFLIFILASFLFPDSSLIRSTTNTINSITSTLTGSKRLPLPFSCPSGATPPPATCPAPPPHPAPPPSAAPPPQPGELLVKKAENLPSCPDYFRWIHEDLRPWNSTGITREMVDRAAKHSDFRLVILDGRVFVETYHRSFQTRDVFTLWGILQLIRRYPGQIPDLDLAFNCGDMPVVGAADYQREGSPAPPPVFHYCKDDTTVDIVFPDWSFWGWPEVNIKPWKQLLDELMEGNKRIKWVKREPYAYWKGNPDVSHTRQDLLKCNVSNGREWNARLFRQDWFKESRDGFKKSDLASQCTYRYKIYIEGRSWSVSEKYILACNSPTLLVKTRYQDFFTRGLVPGQHYWPIRDNDKCRSIKFAVDWGNSHQKEAQKMGKEGSGFVREQLNLDFVYDYMLHLLVEYSKLLKYKPTIPPKGVEFCLESVACPTSGIEKEFLIDSLERSPKDSGPCKIPSPFKPGELDDVIKQRDNATKKIESLETKAWESHHRRL